MDYGEDVLIHEGYHGRPATPSVDMIRQAVKWDKVYKDLNEAIRNGIKTLASVSVELIITDKRSGARGERIMIPDVRVLG